MPKYINADDFIRGGRDFLAGVLFVEKGRREGKTKAMLEELLRHVIRTAPVADVEPVVRCENCAKRGRREEFYWCRPCGYKCNEGKFYCADGERGERRQGREE